MTQYIASLWGINVGCNNKIAMPELKIEQYKAVYNAVAIHNANTTKNAEGKLTTTDRIRAHLAAQAGADVTCPLTCGIFTNICAHASVERDNDKTPYWRTLKVKGELNEKYPGGIDGQKLRLEMEGHTVVQKGTRSFVQDYEDKLAKLT